MQKGETDADPPWGDGERARKRFPFIIIVYNFRKLKYHKNIGPYMGGNQDLTTFLLYQNPVTIM